MLLMWFKLLFTLDKITKKKNMDHMSMLCWLSYVLLEAI